MARLASELEDEVEMEFEDEFESEFEGEDEGEEFLGALGGIARSFLGGGDGEGEDEQEWEDEDEGEEFFRNLSRILRKAAPILRVVAKTAGPLIATAVGGPAAGALARAVTSQLEGEYEDEIEGEFEDLAHAPVSGAQAYAEHLAAQASAASSEAEAEALAGVASYLTLSRRDRRDLRRMIPAMLRGAAVLTRLLYGDRRTRPAVRLVPGIVHVAGRRIARRIAAGDPVDPAVAGQILSGVTQQVIDDGPGQGVVVGRHARALHRRRRYGRGGRPRYRRGYGHVYTDGWGQDYGYGRRRSGGSVYRRPIRSSAVRSGQPIRPRAGVMRVVTPVRIPATASRAARTVRMVSDIPVPRGAVVTGRPVSVSGTRNRRR
jgi:hypothetical protein